MQKFPTQEEIQTIFIRDISFLSAIV